VPRAGGNEDVSSGPLASFPAKWILRLVTSMPLGMVACASIVATAAEAEEWDAAKFARQAGARLRRPRSAGRGALGWHGKERVARGSFP